MQDEVNPKSTKEQERLIDAKISLLHLAKQLGNIQNGRSRGTEPVNRIDRYHPFALIGTG